jgi:hypothetical protein
MKRNPSLVVSCIFLLVPVFPYGLWIYANTKTSQYPANVELFQSYLPKGIGGVKGASWISVAASVIAILLSVKDVESKNTGIKATAIIVLVLAGLLGFLNLFSLM